MATELETRESAEAVEAAETKTKPKKRRGTWLMILFILFLILFIFSTALLGFRLYHLATRDQHTVDLGLGDPEGTVELFRIEYENQDGVVTVRGINADDVVAPGTDVDYDLRLRNKDDVIIDFVMIPTVEFLTGDPVPVEFKLIDSYGNYLLGDEDTWVTADEMNTLAHKGQIHPGEVFTYHLSWQWVFEVDEAQNAYDTYLGNQNGEILPGVSLTIDTESTANPAAPRSNAHMMHLRGEGFGCCWCCYLVWLLILIALLLVVWVWRLRRKLCKREETMEEYEEVLTAHGLMVDGKLVEHEEILS